MKQGNNQVIAIVQKNTKKKNPSTCVIVNYTHVQLLFKIKCINRFNTWYNWDPWNSIQPCTQPYFGDGRGKLWDDKLYCPSSLGGGLLALEHHLLDVAISTQLSTGYFLHVTSESWTQFIYKVTQKLKFFHYNLSYIYNPKLNQIS